MNNTAVPEERGRHYLDRDSFVKQYSRSSALEFEKAQKIHYIAASSKLFSTPAPIAHDAVHSTIRYERLPAGLTSIRVPYIASIRRWQVGGTVDALFMRMGRALAAIHRHLQLSSRSPWAETSLQTDVVPESQIEAAAATEDVHLHCDFGFSNILVSAHAAEDPGAWPLWIIDPSPNYFMTFAPDAVGPPDVDVANLVACTRGLFPITAQWNCNWAAAGVAVAAFIEGYEESSGNALDRTRLLNFTNQTLDRYLEKRFSNPLLRQLARRLVHGESRIREIHRSTQ